MKIINRLGEELIARKQVISEWYTSGDPNPFVLEDTKFIINERYYKGGIINEEVKNALLNNSVSIEEFQNILLKDNKYKKTKEQIEEEIAIFANRLMEQITLQEVEIERSALKISDNLQTLDVYKTIKLTKDVMQNYVGLENNNEAYLKIASKCIVPFFILRIKKIMTDFCHSELLRSNYIKTEFTPVYTKSSKDINEPIMIDFIIKIDINTLEQNENYNDIASYIRNALDNLNVYFEQRTLE
jgi:hypothetical protein